MGHWFFQLAATGPATVRWAGRWCGRHRLLTAILACLFLPLLVHAWYTFLGGNFHTVLPGVLYRSGQPSTAELRRLVDNYQIHTVINLRGDNTDPWYYDEHKTGKELAVKVVDVGLWAGEQPPIGEFHILIDTLADAPDGILVHCSSGSDRTGLAAALGALLRSEATLAQARRQLSLFYGHNPFGRAACQERVLDNYESWLASNSLEHSPAHLRTWAKTVYVPEKCTAPSQ